tara:strand:- start:2053 stop:2697 length:645 start_codon:yes stop_codon:yes gene_type:complete
MNYVKQFQEQYYLEPDGILGPKTAAKMQCVWGRSAEETAHMLGQCFIESKQFTQGRESLNYNVQGLIETFNFYKNNPDLAIKHGRNGSKPADQIAIANTVYDDANRSEKFKLGNTRKGDGWNNRGVTGIQLTGRSNIERFLKWKGLPLDTNRDLIETKYFWDALVFYFDQIVRWRYCDSVDAYACAKVTEIIQGGNRHLAERTAATRKYYALLK